MTNIFRHQKLALGAEALKMLHDKIPDPKKREESWENITQGIQWRFFVDAVRRFDRLLADIEACLTEQSWMAGK